MKPNNITFKWIDSNNNIHNQYYEEDKSFGPNKNILGNVILDINLEYYWEIKVIKGIYIKFGIINIEEAFNIVDNELKFNLSKPFHEYKYGYSLSQQGELQNNNSLVKKIDKILINNDIIGIHIKNKNLGFWINNEFIGWIYYINSDSQFIPAMSFLLEEEKIELINIDIYD